MTRVALALGGGAALGWAHIGVLRALQEAGIEVAAVAGTSIGGLAALCLAADRLDVFEALARSATRVSVLRYLDPHFKKGAVLGGRTIQRELRQHFGSKRIEQLHLPAAVVASDLTTGLPHIIDHGLLVDAARATMALPGIFAPVHLDHHILIDGGATMPVPVRVARQLAPDLPVIAINLQGDYHGRAHAVGLQRDRRGRLSTMGIVRAATGLTLTQLARYSLDRDPPDLELAPPVAHIDGSNFTRADELIRIGRETVIQSLPKIRALAGMPPHDLPA